MPRFKTPWTFWILLVANLGLPLRPAFFGYSPLWLVVESVAHGLMFYAYVAPSCGWLIPIITRFRTDKKEIWLTIDDGPIPGKTSELSAELAKRDARATFFLIGDRLQAMPEITTYLTENRHSVGNHSFSHPLATFWALPPSQLTREIDECQRLLKNSDGSEERRFRSPFGIKNLFLASVLAAREMRMIAWSVRAHDGLVCKPGKVIQRVANRVKAGDIILMHERGRENIEAILGVVDELHQRGFSFVIPSDSQLITG